MAVTFGTGILLEFFDWNSFFGLNVVLSLLAAAGTLALVPRSADEHPPQEEPDPNYDPRTEYEGWQG